MDDFVKQPLLSSEGATSGSFVKKTPVSSDPHSRNLLEFIARVAPSDAPVLISGETGTGKEFVARYIHSLSGRAGPFVIINCEAISEQIADGDLPGQDTGLFSDSEEQRNKWFSAAHEGTLFLDEICNLSLPLQAKLLRVFQEDLVSADATGTLNLRLVAATCIDIDAAVAAGTFRCDLFYRINIVQIKLPPLRERRGDILPLAEHYLKNYCRKIKLEQPAFTKEAAELLVSYSWPGNIPELEKVVQFALLVAGQGEIYPKHLKVTGGWEAGVLNPSLRNAVKRPANPGSDQKPNQLSPGAAGEPLTIIGEQLTRLFDEAGAGPNFDKLESLITRKAFLHAGSNQVHGAVLLGISRNVMRTLLKRHGLLNGRGD